MTKILKQTLRAVTRILQVGINRLLPTITIDKQIQRQQHLPPLIAQLGQISPLILPTAQVSLLCLKMCVAWVLAAPFLLLGLVYLVASTAGT